ncbi:unnamed protein product (macronuclear) [Paramecium tetraurelia]|uniref:C2HC/C3H-type domain-containing protein n=1 Tax=Paramecium tetraurelia TaxID=5888 RepID=A0E7F3_PARTE|nr:uncharacterized protein GSPATT00023948001 [Paramecium tetraurelia]CAK91220.1 unnamed protein product [Paramecium tetraurelia]|eukprot:XP_001458617.1 hypothetical protein (macronuclear) [Paramecium tetraurelia strain d4-2]
MSKQSKQVSVQQQIPQNTLNKQLNTQTSPTLKPKIESVSTIQKPLQNLSNVPTRTQEDQIKRTQPRSPIRQTFEKKTLENKSCISNFDEKPIPKILQRGKSPQSNQTARNTKAQDQQASQPEKQSTQQKQPIQFKSNEPDQLPTNQSNTEKATPNLSKQQAPVQQKQQTKLQLQSNQLKSQNNQQQQQSIRPKTATTSQLQLKQTVQQDQLLKSTRQDLSSRPNTQQTKSQLNVNKKQEVPNKPRQQPMLKGEQVVEEKLYQCPEGCGRSFNAKALEKHSKICKKVFQQKRKVFNSQKQRQIEAEDNVKGRGGAMKRQVQKQPMKQGQKQQQQVKSEKPKWKAQSEAFRAIIRQAKGQRLTKEEQTSLSGAMESAQDLVQCKFCNRKFNTEAAKKHIVFCETKAKQCGKSGVQKKKK